jgi:hypothetical protein
MAEIKIALAELKEETESGVTAAAVTKPASRWRWSALGAAGAALSAAIFLLLPRETGAPLKEVPLTSFPGYQGEPALSPMAASSLLSGTAARKTRRHSSTSAWSAAARRCG